LGGEHFAKQGAYGALHVPGAVALGAGNRGGARGGAATLTLLAHYINFNVLFERSAKGYIRQV